MIAKTLAVDDVEQRTDGSYLPTVNQVFSAALGKVNLKEKRADCRKKQGVY